MDAGSFVGRRVEPGTAVAVGRVEERVLRAEDHEEVVEASGAHLRQLIGVVVVDGQLERQCVARRGARLVADAVRPLRSLKRVESEIETTSLI